LVALGSRQNVALEDNLSNEELVVEELGERATGEWNPSDRLAGLERANVGATPARQHEAGTTVDMPLGV
jgi:hypothetical protein